MVLEDERSVRRLIASKTALDEQSFAAGDL